MKDEALRLAEALEARGFLGTTASDAAAELRRLSAIEAQRDALLEALRAMLEQFNYNTITGIVHDESAAIAKARAAIAAVEGEKT